MKHKYTILFGAAAGVGMAVLWSIVFFRLLNVPGIFVGIGFGAAFASCGCLLGGMIDQKKNTK